MRTGNVGFVGRLVRWSLIGLLGVASMGCGNEDPKPPGNGNSLIALFFGR